MTDVFQALAHPARRRIIAMLKTKELSAGDIADRLDMPKPTVSGHLNALKAAGLIDAERHGTSLIYAINVSVAEDALSMAFDLLKVGDGAALERPANAARKRRGTQ
ncbi:MAG: metalloregulator ArsR/SmtB family transcription factor [Pseudomonadota bacterium]